MWSGWLRVTQVFGIIAEFQVEGLVEERALRMKHMSVSVLEVCSAGGRGGLALERGVRDGVLLDMMPLRCGFRCSLNVRWRKGKPKVLIS